MLKIELPEREFFNNKKNEFIVWTKRTLTLEHSLIAISKWESKWKKPFLENKARTLEESKDYIKCMSVNKELTDEDLLGLTQKEMKQINAYIEDPMTATWFNEKHGPKGPMRGQIVTSELIYYWMIAYEIPFECQKWHLNRLLTLIKVCDEKNKPGKKMTKNELKSRYQSLNSANRHKYGSKG